MKNKKGIIQTGVVVAIVAILGLTIAGTGYMMYKKNMPSVEVGADGVEVDADGVSVKTGSDGVSVNMDGTSVDTNGGNVSVKTNGTTVNTGGEVQEGEEVKAEEKVNTVLIFDASGSMSAQAQGGTRIKLAKDAMTKFVDNLKSDVNLSVVAYGHKGNNTQAGKAVSCAGIEEIYYMGEVNASIVKSKVNALNPNGWTPIADSLKKAENILVTKATQGKKHIVLLSDGEETCGGDPVAYACELKSKGISVDVIGLDVTGAVAKQLTDISKCGGGEYYSVDSASDFDVVVNDMGVKVNTGNLNVDISGDSVKVNTGDLDVTTDGSGTKVDAGGVKVDANDNGVDVDVNSYVPSF
ncbi:MAG: D-amino-acid dehydrogenase [Candidatus Moranbacteria bacterium GW2011_GWF2_34_56]|nr:MAG: D-amino-acid dehydrogenase [Candidatus Moranbacteria bacterium GW2011_GWF1_34_10]KKP63502.1 MAG: D-amino-acid dehydrogenase [Candidatus Moranbacteria bacterium GW2011_GWF2_34_56]HBI16712.1 hypothetical protein [Candidatus Moranbacteria bacterium]